MTGSALLYVLHNIFTPNMGMRADSQRIVVLITDGDSLDDVLLPSQSLKDAGIEIFAVGVREGNMTELRSIGSNPKKLHVYRVKDFSLLSNIAKKLIISICDGAYNLGAYCKTTYKADIVLLVDDSGSISQTDFQTMLSFIAAIVRVFNIGPDGVQIGLVQYSDVPKTEWHLNTHHNKQALLKAIENLQQQGGNTKTGSALLYVLHNIFTPNMGMRADSQRIVVLITDGDSLDDVLLPSQSLKDAGIEIFAVGVREANMTELRSIGSNPKKLHVYRVKDFSLLSNIAKKLIISICDGAYNLGAYCKTTYKADIVLLVDDSGSISQTAFQTMLSFIAEIVRVFNIGPDGVQIGLVQYSDFPMIKWHLNTYNTKQALLMAIDTLDHRGGSTKTGMALHLVPNMGMRADSQRIVVLITDGESQDDVLLPSQSLKDAGIEIFAVGVQNAHENELRAIASDPDEIHVYIVMNFAHLSEIIHNFLINLCDSIHSLDPLRLVGGSSRCAGTLEMKRGEWRPLYASNWTLKSAEVACRELDCGSAVSTEIRNESSIKSVWQRSSDCVQSGSAMRECVSSDSSLCILGITCSDSLRLVNGSSLCSGRLEVKSNQSNQWWSSVCEDDFDQQDAEVVCRELGCGAPSVLQGALYGEVEAPMWSKEFQCGGNESALLDCRSLGSARNTCSPGKAVGLTCSESVRLVGGDSRCAGTLEVKQGEWRPVIGSDWNLTSASVVCRELNCGSAVLIVTKEESSVKSAWWISSDCVHSGSALRECATSSVTSYILNITCFDPTVHMIRVVVLLLTLLVVTTALYFYCKASRGQKPGRQENIELDDYNLGVPAAGGGPTEEEGAQGAE
ncbi:collagen alpha-4(VI) chain-like [Dicentrarchus labrax]|nr:collagen alpha-4(VI) chain-like [Dicentrarchus labrax]